MRITILRVAGAAATALIAMPALAETVRGELVSIDEESVTVLSDGELLTFVVPGGVEFEPTRDEDPQLVKGQRVTLTIEELAEEADRIRQEPATIKISVDDEVEREGREIEIERGEVEIEGDEIEIEGDEVEIEVEEDEIDD